MLHNNQKKLFDSEKQELQDKLQKINNQIKEEQDSMQKLQIEIEHKKSKETKRILINYGNYF